MERATSIKLDMGHRMLTNHAPEIQLYRNYDMKLIKHVQYKHSFVCDMFSAKKNNMIAPFRHPRRMIILDFDN